MSDPTPSLNAAFAQFQAALPKISKGETAEIPGKDGKKGFKYKYADLADVAEAVLPALGAVGISYQSMTGIMDGEFVLYYWLAHESGETSEKGVYPLPHPARISPQQHGSAMTYARRYCLTLATGVAPNGDDDDAGAAQQGWGNSPSAAFADASPARPQPKPKTSLAAWKKRIAAITDKADADKADEAIRTALKEGRLDAGQSDELTILLDDRAAQLAAQAEKTAQEPAAAPARPVAVPDPEQADAADGDDAEAALFADINRQISEAATPGQAQSLLLRIGKAVKAKQLTPEAANDLSKFARERKAELEQEPSAA